MNKIFASAIMVVAMLGSVSETEACTNFIVGKKASVDGSVMCSYSADYRGGDWLDLAANTTGAVLASLIAYFVVRPRMMRK